MRKIITILLAGVFTLSAVEWDKELINEDADFINAWSLIALGPESHPYVAFFESYMSEETPSLRVASKTSGTWEIKNVAPVLEPSFAMSLDIDSEGNSFLTYTDLDSMVYVYNLYLASDSSGEFTSKKIEGDSVDCYATAMKVGTDGKIHIAYVRNNYEIPDLRYGWFEGGTFHSEKITDEVAVDMLVYIDLVLVEGIPHVFYMDTSYEICHASQSLTSFAGWDIEPVSDGLGIMPSAGVDSQGKLHVTYRGGEYFNNIMYATNRTGSWQDELAAQTNDPEEMGIGITLALDPQETPHVAWTDYDSTGQYDIYRAHSTSTGWDKESVSETPDSNEITLLTPFFAIDTEGYGHITYTVLDVEEEFPHVYYAKSKEPLVSAITENPPEIKPLGFVFIGSEVRFSLPQSGEVSLNLYDACGRRVGVLASGFYSSGEHSIPLNTSTLSRGVYFLSGQIGKQAASVKFVKNK